MLSNEILVTYHPVKKQVIFSEKNNENWQEINSKNSGELEEYMNKKGDFLLQNEGNDFFQAIINYNNGNPTDVTYKGTAADYEDFKNMVKFYNDSKHKSLINLKEDFIKLPDVENIYQDIRHFYDEIIEYFDDFDLNQKDSKYERTKKSLNEMISEFSENDVNICFVGVYSSGKSTLINTLIGEAILPESTISETGKITKIINSKKEVSICFDIRKDWTRNSVKLIWSEKNNKFIIESQLKNSKILSQITEATNNFHSEYRYQHVCHILKDINDMPNKFDLNNDEYIDNVVTVCYPMDICNDKYNFVIYDTPGTDSNSDEHSEILENALKKQTHSILVVVYHPTKTEGSGNNLLYNIITNFKNNKDENNTSIDISRSIHVINRTDEINNIDEDIKKLKNNKIEFKEPTTGSKTTIDLSKERLLFVSALAAYTSRIMKKGLNTKNDERNKNRLYPTVNNEYNDGSGKYYRFNKLAEAENATNKLKNKCEENAENAHRENDIHRETFINSGMFALEDEIKNYAVKYALSVKANIIYNSANKIIELAKGDYESKKSICSQEKSKIEGMANDVENELIGKLDSLFENKIKLNDSNKYIIDLGGLHSFFDSKTEEFEKFLNKKMPHIAIRYNNNSEQILKKIEKYVDELIEKYKETRKDIIDDKIRSINNEIHNIIKANMSEDHWGKLITYYNPQYPEEKQVSYPDLQDVKKCLIFIDRKKYKNNILAEYRKLIDRYFSEFNKNINKIYREALKKIYEQSKEDLKNFSEDLKKYARERDKLQKEIQIYEKILTEIDKKSEKLNNKIWGISVLE